MRSGALPAALLGFVLSSLPLYSADMSTYRGFQFGTSVAAAMEKAGARPGDVRIVHSRPALIQELNWRPSSPYQTETMAGDPVREGLLRFYNGELFQVVTTYDRQKIEGMSDSDMVNAISKTYGPATKPNVTISFHSNYGEVAPVIARWEDPEYSYNLVRTGDQSSFALVLSSKRLERLAQAATTEAVRLDLLEAPQRAMDLQKQQMEDKRLERDKARLVNSPNFRP